VRDDPHGRHDPRLGPDTTDTTETTDTTGAKHRFSVVPSSIMGADKPVTETSRPVASSR